MLRPGNAEKKNFTVPPPDLSSQGGETNVSNGERGLPPEGEKGSVSLGGRREKNASGFESDCLRKSDENEEVETRLSKESVCPYIIRDD